ncbi:5'-3' exoribonuclease 2 [Coccomyxa sp. Obi]|nr:5'-3' exoribonuclease 2 [Coccomyxa sp. Obi]
MGVPGLFGWLRKKYPLIVRPSSAALENHQGSANGLCDNLYIDMNHIIHACTHPSWRCTPYLSEEEMFLDMQIYLNHIFDTARPSRLFMVAMDGVAPQAKMNQQRTRRFFSAYREELSAQLEAEVRREMQAVLGPDIVIPELPSFDGNVITPGTAFMARLAAMLRAFFATKLQTDPAWGGVAVVLSDSSEPGEGEHKIMRFIRHLRTLSGHDPNTRHVIYGQDADLILLALLTHEPHFAILREARREATGEHTDLEDMLVTQQPLEYLDISVLRQFLRHEFAELLEPKAAYPDVERTALGVPVEEEQDGPDLRGAAAADAAPTALDFERLLEDFVLLTFLAGNDFLPNVPSLDIYDYPKSALDTLLETYKAVLPGSGYLTKSSKLIAGSLRTLLTRLAADEQPAISRRQEQAMRQHRRQMSKDAAVNGADMGGSGGFTGPDQSGQWVSVGELRSGESLEEALSGLSTGGGQTEEQERLERLRSASPSQLRQELSRRVAERLEDRLKGPALAEPITYRGSMADFRSRHYQQRFGAEPGEGVEKVARKVSQAYIQTLAWSLVYYSHGTLPVLRHRNGNAAQISATSGSSFPCGAPWDWYFPHHYAPMMSDLAKHSGALGKIKSPAQIQPEAPEPSGSWAPQYGPVRPLLQLMAVLPPQSAGCLPYKLARLLRETQQVHEGGNGASVAAALADMFPADLAPLIDMAGKRWAHTAVVKLPFADVKRLAVAAQQQAQDERELTEEEEARNDFGAASLMLSGFHCMADHVRAWGEGTPLPEDSIDGCADESVAESAATLLSLAVQPKEPMNFKDAAVLELALDLAGVSTPPFSSQLLPGVREESSGATKRAWLDMKSAHRADIKSAVLNGRGRGRFTGRPSGVPRQRQTSAYPSAPNHRPLGAATTATQPTTGFPPPATARALHAPQHPVSSDSNHRTFAVTAPSPNGAASSMAASSYRPKPGNVPVYNSAGGLIPVRRAASASDPCQASSSGVPHPQQILANGHQKQHDFTEPAFPGPAHAPRPLNALRRPQPINGYTTEQSHQRVPEPLPRWPPGFPPPAARPAGTPTSSQGPAEHAPGGPGGRAPAQQPPSGPRVPAQQPPAGGTGGRAPSQQADALADMMSALLPPAAPGDPIADIVSFLLPPAAPERSAAAGQPGSAALSTGSILPASAAVPDTSNSGSLASPIVSDARSENNAAPADAASAALAHLLGGLQPGASLSSDTPAGSASQRRDGVLRVSLPVVSLKRHAYNPMQAAKPVQPPGFS